MAFLRSLREAQAFPWGRSAQGGHGIVGRPTIERGTVGRATVGTLIVGRETCVCTHM